MVLSEPNKEAGGRMNVFHYTAFVVQIIRENGLVFRLWGGGGDTKDISICI